MLEVAQDTRDGIGLDQIVILGDFLDFFGVTLHDKNYLEDEFDFHQEIHEGIEALKRLRELFPDTKIVYIEGNHEFRLQRYIWKNAKELYGMISVPTLLTLDNLKIEWIPYGKYQKYQIYNSPLFARHEPFSAGKNCASGTIMNGRGASWIFGHTHRVQYAQENDINLQAVEAYSCGWLGKMGGEVYNYIKNHEQWMHCFGMGIFYSNDNYHLDLIKIKNYECVYNGKYYSASNEKTPLPVEDKSL